MHTEQLKDFTTTTAHELGIPGASVGVLTAGRRDIACHGITSIENPIEVDPHTLFLLGSVSKTATATTLMTLVADGAVELDAPVRRYVPELELADAQVADNVTVLQLLNHTSGLDWGLIVDTGEGDTALADYVGLLPQLDLLAPAGTRASYSQAGYNLIGRIVEKVAGVPFETAVSSRILEPLGMTDSFYTRDDVMTRRFSVGHNRDDDGLSVARLWRRARGDNPGGGLASSVADQLTWAAFHLGDAPAGASILPAELRREMQNPTIELRASNLGDAIGLCWFLRGVDGVHTIGHAGSANGQFAEVLLVPEAHFAVVAMSNAGPDGIAFNKAAVRWALETYLGVQDRDPEPLPFDARAATAVTGQYENEVMTLTIDVSDDGLRLEVLIKPEIRAASDKQLPPDHAPFPFGLLAGPGDGYVITAGAFNGQRGFFKRDAQGRVTGVDLAGRLFSRAAKLRGAVDSQGCEPTYR